MRFFWMCWIAMIVLCGTLAVPAPATAQPLSNIYQQPTVSPYLNLTARQGGGLPAYQTLVRPLIQQQQENIRQQQQIQQLSQQQQNLAAGGLTQPARGISRQIRGTGHVAGFMVRGNYFPRSPMQANDPITRRLVTMDYTQ